MPQSAVLPLCYASLAWLLSSTACTSSHDIATAGEVVPYMHAGSAAAGSGGGGVTAGSSSTPAPTSPGGVRCGASECVPPTNPLSGLLGGFGTGGGALAAAACCIDAALGTCGVATSAGACEPLAVSDPRCPGLDLSEVQSATSGLGGQLSALATLGALSAAGTQGCCIENACGQDGAILGRGCVENAEASSALAAVPLIGSLVKVPAARNCDQGGLPPFLQTWLQSLQR
ncbi:MAG: hypothetical protein RL701_7109 [Pseudomonadota bacterium]